MQNGHGNHEPREKYFGHIADEESRDICRMEREDPLLHHTNSTPAAEDLAAITRCCVTLCKRLKSKLDPRPVNMMRSNVLAKNLPTAESTVGIAIQGTRIESIRLGGSAFVAGVLQEGDSITKVDGMLLTKEDIIPALRGSDLPGSTVSITVNRPAQSANERAVIKDVHLIRLSSKEADERQRLFEHLYSIKASHESSLQYFLAQSPLKSSEAAISPIDECISLCVEMLAAADQQRDAIRSSRGICQDVDDLRECLEGLHHRIESLSRELNLRVGDDSLSKGAMAMIQRSDKISQDDINKMTLQSNFRQPRNKMFSSNQMLRILRSNRAKMVACANSLQEVNCSVSIEEVLRAAEASDRYILVRKCSTSTAAPSEIILNRLDLVHLAMEAESILQPLSSCDMVINSRPVEFVKGDDTLDKVVAKMVSTGREDIAVMDQGVIRGLITCKILFTFIRYQLQTPNSTLSHRRRVSLTTNVPLMGSRPLLRPSLGSTRALDAVAIEAGIQGERPSPRTFELRNASSLKKRGSTAFSHLPSGGACASFTGGVSSNEDELVVKTHQESRNERQERVLFSDAQMGAQYYCVSWCSDLWITLCVTVDMAIGIYGFFNGSDVLQTESFTATGCILAAYFYERSIRCYGFFQRLLYHPFWLVDFLIVDASVFVYILVLSGGISKDSKTITTLMRVLRMLRISLIIRNMHLAAKVRRVISSQKTRYKQDGFDLDLTYITKNVIAMSLPALGAEASYRNPLTEVQLFFAKKHPNHFLIFNLCEERYYDPELFDGRVERIEVEDHNPPRMSQIIAFVERAGEFIDEDPENCLAVHCKGGKGRTGVMICAWLMYSRFSSTAVDALGWFSVARTGNKASLAQGVSQPSQKRYLKYMEEALLLKGVFSPSLELQEIVIKTCPKMKTYGGCDIWFTIEENGRMAYDYRNDHENSKMSESQDEMIINVGFQLQGDIRVMFYDHEDGDEVTLERCCNIRGKEDHFEEGDDLIFFMWFHTGFVKSRNLVFDKEDIDVACHDKRCKVFSEKFAVEFRFANIPEGYNSDTDAKEKGPYRKIIQPSQALIERSQMMRSGQQDPKAAHSAAVQSPTRMKPFELTLARVTSVPARSADRFPSGSEETPVSRGSSQTRFSRYSSDAENANKV